MFWNFEFRMPTSNDCKNFAEMNRRCFSGCETTICLENKAVYTNLLGYWFSVSQCIRAIWITVICNTKKNSLLCLGISGRLHFGFPSWKQMLQMYAILTCFRQRIANSCYLRSKTFKQSSIIIYLAPIIYNPFLCKLAPSGTT